LSGKYQARIVPETQNHVERKGGGVIIIEGDQGTPEWMALRVGNPGASGMDKIITSQGKPSTQRQKHLYQMAGEIITGSKAETYQNAHMARGTEIESEAREMFEFVHGPVQQCSLIYQDERKLWHVSPDGIMPDRKAGLEIKCPSLPVHVEYLDKGKLPTAYKIQVQSSMMVTGWPAWFFVSYYPGMKPLILKIERDEALIKQIQDSVEKFCADLQKLVERLK
jgi:putative phage-type endonuclease